MTNLKNLTPLTDKEIQDYWPTVKKIVNIYISSKQLPNHLNKEDLYQELYGALLEAIRTYKENKGTKKTTWIKKIVYFRLIDFLRSDSWIPRPSFYKLRDSDSQIPKQYTIGDLTSSTSDTSLSFDNFLDDSMEFIEEIETKDLATYLFKTRDKNITKRDATILYRYFMTNKNMKTIGKSYNLTESRISQIISNYLPNIKELINNYIKNTK